MSLRFGAAPYDKTARYITLAPFVIIIGVAGSLFFYHKVLMPPNLVILLLVLLCPYLWAPRYYTVSDQSITIKRLIGDVTIQKSGITSMEIVDPAPIKLRLFGSGGFFGYYGIFTLAGGGRAKLHCTRVNQVVVINTAQQIYIVSPAKPGEFIQSAFNGNKLVNPGKE